jgi:hypothetical protein
MEAMNQLMASLTVRSWFTTAARLTKSVTLTAAAVMSMTVETSAMVVQDALTHNLVSANAMD